MLLIAGNKHALKQAFVSGWEGLLAEQPSMAVEDISDAALVGKLPSFESQYAEVRGIRLRHVIGGQGDLVILLPGWPQTW